MSWLFSRALVEAFLEGCSEDGELCAQLNVMPTAHPFWRNGKPMDASRLSRFGLTLRLLTADRGEELLMWFLADFPVRTSALRDQETDSTESAPGSGERWRGSFARYDRASSSWRTAQCSLLGDSIEYSETWPKCGSMLNGVCYLQPMLAPSIYAKESGLLPTPTTIDTGSRFNRSASNGAALCPTLGAMARFDLWPTPTVKGNYNRKGLTSKSGDGLATAVIQRERWATPLARDFKGPGMSKKRRAQRSPDNLCSQVRETDGNGRLNPNWVEWLMGWPIGWTALQPLEMGKFHEWLQQHSGCYAPGSSHS